MTKAGAQKIDILKRKKFKISMSPTEENVGQKQIQTALKLYIDKTNGTWLSTPANLNAPRVRFGRG